MPPPSRSRIRPGRSSKALGAVVAMSGLFAYQTAGIDASSSAPNGQKNPADPPLVSAPINDPTADDPAADDPAADAPVDAELTLTGYQADETELIARLERILRANREELKKQQALLDDGPDSSYRRAEQEYADLTAQVEKTEAALDAATIAEEQEKAAELQKQLEDLKQLQELAKVRFEVEVRERKAATEQVDLLIQAIAADELRLRQLLGDEPEAPAEPPAAGPEDAATDPTVADPAAPAEPATAPTQAPTIPGLPGLPVQPPQEPAPAAPPEEPSEEVVQARQAVETKAEAAERAARLSESLDERLQLIDRKLESVREQLLNAQLKSDNARETRGVLSEDFRNKSLEGVPPEDLRHLEQRIIEAEDAAREAIAEVRDRTRRLEEVREERDLIVEARETVRRDAALAQLELEMAQANLRETINPFSPRNLSRWFVTRGPGLLMLLIVSVLLVWLINRFGSRVATMMAQRGTRGSLAEREDRAKTLVSVFQNASSAVILVGAFIMALDHAGVPIAPLLGGAAVLGLAISFGAQNLVADFFYGFVILMENQYKLNDVVKINDHSGQVEAITLRMTALRDLEGSLHFIPNGQISSVVNMTHGWSRALFDIGVAYKEDVDRVMEVILELGKELRQDPRFRPLILEDPTMLGVDAFADSAVMIKFFIKTRPLQQWAVKRELLRRIKNRFDAEGIEIPFPHRTVFHRMPESGLGRFSIEAEPTLDDGNGHAPAAGNSLA